MATRKEEPTFEKGVCILTGHDGQCLELNESTWNDHIIRDSGRAYFRGQFGKIQLTARSPDRIISDAIEKNVVHYEKFFVDFCILNSIRQEAYLYVIANCKTLRVRTIYLNYKAAH